MKTHVQDTSLAAYRKEVRPTLGRRQEAVYRLLSADGPLSNMEIAQRLGWSINRVTGRVFELRKSGRIEFRQKRTCRSTGRMVRVWGIKAVQQSLFP